MRVRDHAVISAAGAVLAAPVFRRGALGLWAGSVLIDVDHYAWFCLRHRTVNPLAAMRLFTEADAPQHPGTRALHSPVVLSAVLLLGLRQRKLLPVAVGMSLHAALDSYHTARLNRARSAALARDDYTCRTCGTAAPPVGAHLWRQPTVLPSYQVENLISLCTRCHKAEHARMTGPASWM